MVTVCCPSPSVVNLPYPRGEVNSGLTSMVKVTVEAEGVGALCHCSSFMTQMESCFEIVAKIQTLSPTSCVFLGKSLPSLALGKEGIAFSYFPGPLHCDSYMSPSR